MAPLRCATSLTLPRYAQFFLSQFRRGGGWDVVDLCNVVLHLIDATTRPSSTMPVVCEKRCRFIWERTSASLSHTRDIIFPSPGCAAACPGITLVTRSKFWRRWSNAENVGGVRGAIHDGVRPYPDEDRKSTRLNSSHVAISYAVFCLKNK